MPVHDARADQGVLWFVAKADEDFADCIDTLFINGVYDVGENAGWVSVGISYQHDEQSFQKALPTSGGGSVQGDVSLEHHAVSVPIAIGVDYRVTKFLSVGPSFELAINNPIAGCVSTSAAGFAGSTYCSNTEPGKNFVKADTYLAWNAGLDAKVTF